MSEAVAQRTDGAIRSLVPARMDRLPWTKFHWSVVFGLGVSWILDGLEIQIVSESGFQKTLGMSAAQVGLTGTVYLVGQVVGALTFGRLTDRLGRRRLFIMTLVIYLVGSGLAGLSPNMWFLWVCRFGAFFGALANLYLLNPDNVAENIGWRLAFFIGPILGLSIIWLRRHIPESPRWLLTHGRAEEAERTVDEIEERVRSEGVELEPVDESKALEVTEPPRLTIVELTRLFFGTYPKRSVYAFTMMVTQAFLFNAIFFSYALVLKVFYSVPEGSIPYYFFPFAIGNLLGPLLLGHLFDVIGRRKMILFTYGLSGVLLLITAWMFYAGILSAVTQTVAWSIIFFFASAGASSAYLTVSEIFPIELRGQAISYFFALSQGAGGVVAPFLFGHLIGGANNTNVSRTPLAWGYVLGALIMITGGLVAWFIGVDSERQSLEDIADPLSSTGR